MVGSTGVTCRSQLTLFWLQIQDGHHGSHLENLIWSTAPKWKGKLTWNKIGSNRMTCWIITAKIVPTENPRWLSGLPSWKSTFSHLTERQIDSSWLVQTQPWGNYGLTQGSLVWFSNERKDGNGPNFGPICIIITKMNQIGDKVRK